MKIWFAVLIFNHGFVGAFPNPGECYDTAKTLVRSAVCVPMTEDEVNRRGIMKYGVRIDGDFYTT